MNQLTGRGPKFVGEPALGKEFLIVALHFNELGRGLDFEIPKCPAGLLEGEKR